MYMRTARRYLAGWLGIRVLIELADPTHQVIAAKLVNFTLPDPEV
jgi:hypothetical protein